MGVYQKIKETIGDYIRVLRIAKKPTKDEYKLMIKVTGIGMLIIGFIGFIIQMIKQLIELII